MWPSVAVIAVSLFGVAGCANESTRPGIGADERVAWTTGVFMAGIGLLCGVFGLLAA